MKRHKIAAASAIVLLSVVSTVAAECPPAVTAAVLKAHAGASIASCKNEQEDGKTQFEVKLASMTGKGISLDVTPDGSILMTEQSIAVSDVPPVVMKAFAAKYQATKPTRAEMQTSGDGKVTYELAFRARKSNKEATFTAEGKFTEEE